ncbi:putative sec20 domain-containing protein [Phaeoacremonium minimum UCRPA7]|uniref:Putative sec20 domain-containing protein n=1 Tax=Phaeoacremonium minimum (strain UCR-PA7) TaxID=1286976 RepID=R8BRM1_PHAM7|nr:putative sec20 domain-containing protein [Phaeoacremonium minimum UCRPA7]EOO01935.1 putative sec20 domain-containing protein [Phaeoacremonium minimum UCRPA7]
MSFEALQERLAALQDTTSQLKELIDRLANLKFQPGSVPLSSSISSLDEKESNVATELGAEINQILREEEEDLELLQEEIADLRGGRPGSEAEHNKTRLKDGARSCRVSFRKAQLAAAHSLAAAQRLERELLLASYAAASQANTPTRSGASSPAPSLYPRRRREDAARSKAEAENPELAASSDVTASFRRLHALTQTQLQMSAAAMQTLGDSTQQLKQLGQSYNRLDDLLASSKDLLGTLLHSQKSDTWYLQTALYMLMVTAGWLVFRRLLAVGRLGGDGGARVEVDGDARRIMVCEDELDAVPTVQVGKGQTQTEKGDPDSMVEKVGKIIDGQDEKQEDGIDGVRNASEQAQPNPKKRMWEEDKEAAKEAERIKDEL